MACIHTGRAIYSCTYCQQMFRSNGNLYQHKKKIHPDEWLNDRKKGNFLKISLNQPKLTTVCS